MEIVTEKTLINIIETRIADLGKNLFTVEHISSIEWGDDFWINLVCYEDIDTIEPLLPGVQAFVDGLASLLDCPVQLTICRQWKTLKSLKT